MKNLRKFDEIELISLAKKKGFIVGHVLVNPVGFFTLCRFCGFNPERLKFGWG